MKAQEMGQSKIQEKIGQKVQEKVQERMSRNRFRRRFRIRLGGKFSRWFKRRSRRRFKRWFRRTPPPGSKVPLCPQLYICNLHIVRIPSLSLFPFLRDLRLSLFSPTKYVSL